MAYRNLELGNRGAVRTIVVNRPDKLNALDRQTLNELTLAFAQAAQDDAVRVVVLAGAGEKAFVAGADISEMSGCSSVQAQAFSRAGQRLMSSIERLGKPVIARVQGFALGGGMELAMACHLRVASEKAKFGQPEINLGLIPGFGGTQRYPRLMGRGRALEHLILGTQVSAEECYRTGLVNRLSREGQTLDDARTMARELAKRPPIATRLIIEAVDDGIHAPIDQAIEVEVRAFLQSLRTEDAGEGIQAFFQKRPADFKGR